MIFLPRLWRQHEPVSLGRKFRSEWRNLLVSDGRKNGRTILISMDAVGGFELELGAEFPQIELILWPLQAIADTFMY